MNRIQHTEFASTDTKATMAFFEAMFGWKFEDAQSPAGEYNMAGDENGSVAVRPLMEHEPAPYATPYVTVDDLVAKEEEMKAKGAEVMVSQVQVPGGMFSWFKVPGDFYIACWEHQEHQQE